MAWHFGTTPAMSQPATPAAAMWLWVQTMIAAGATKVKDSDGTTYSSSGAQVTGGASGAHGLDNLKAWVALRLPNGRQYVVQRDAASGFAWYAKLSPSAGFTGGSPSATQVPSATDEELLASSAGPDSGPTFSPVFANYGWAADFACAAQDVPPYAFYAIGWQFVAGTSPPNGFGVCCWFSDGIVSPGMTGDPDPFADYWDGNGGTSVGTPSGMNSDVLTFTLDGAAPYLGSSYARVVPPVGFAPTSGLDPDYGNGNDQLGPITYGVGTAPSGALGLKGYGALFYWLLTGANAGVRHYTPTLDSLVSSQDRISLNGISFPWDGSTPADASTGPFTAELVQPLTGGVAPSLPPVISSLSPTAGSTLTSFEAVTFHLTDPNPVAFAEIVIVAKLGSGAAELVYTLEDGFFATYNASSGVSTITNGYAFSIVRGAGGWIGPSLALEIIGVDVAGNKVVASYSYTAPSTSGASMFLTLNGISWSVGIDQAQPKIVEVGWSGRM